MKAILMSIRPEWVAKILNGEKTIEIRKKFPKDYVGWVYIYCTKNGNDYYGMPTDLVDYRGCAIYNKFKLMPKGEKVTTDDNQPRLNGKVVARFWCDKVEEIACEQLDNGVGKDTFFYTDSITDITKDSCLDTQDLINYLGAKSNGEIVGTAIHINDLEIFDKPKELWEFKTPKNAEKYKRDLEQARKEDLKIMRHIEEPIDMEYYGVPNCVELTELSEGYYGLTRAPQSWCYVEV